MQSLILSFTKEKLRLSVIGVQQPTGIGDIHNHEE